MAAVYGVGKEHRWISIHVVDEQDIQHTHGHSRHSSHSSHPSSESQSQHHDDDEDGDNDEDDDDDSRSNSNSNSLVIPHAGSLSSSLIPYTPSSKYVSLSVCLFHPIMCNKYIYISP